jgi:molecular chaperone DnaK (HSP70)
MPRIKVIFTVDVNGIMSVQATEETTGNKNKIIIENRKDRLNKDDIDKMIKEADKYSEYDKMIKQKIEARNYLDNYISSLKRTIETSEYKIKLGEKFNEIFIKLIEYENWLEESESVNNITIDNYKNKQKELENYVLPIFKNFM